MCLIKGRGQLRYRWNLPQWRHESTSSSDPAYNKLFLLIRRSIAEAEPAIDVAPRPYTHIIDTHAMVCAVVVFNNDYEIT